MKKQCKSQPRDYALTTPSTTAHVHCSPEFAASPESVKWLSDLIERVATEPVPEAKTIEK